MRPATRERRAQILEQLFTRQTVTASEVARTVGVSEATVRRDLRALAEDGRVRLVHGGATLSKGSDYSLQAKSQRNVEAKRQIARLAAELVADGDQIFLGSGSTTFEMAAHLKRRHGLSVITNSARLALALDSPSLNIILLGGHYRADRMDMVGALALNALDQLRGYKAFMGVDGVSMDFGLSAADMDGAHLYRMAAERAREIILIVDSSKFQAPSLWKIVGWDAVSVVVTDSRPAQAWEAFFSKRRIAVVTPEGAGVG